MVCSGLELFIADEFTAIYRYRTFQQFGLGGDMRSQSALIICYQEVTQFITSK